MIYVIDGYNLAAKVRGSYVVGKPEKAIPIILDLVRGKSATVVFDGYPSKEIATCFGKVKIIWSGDETADDVIFKLVRKNPNAVVVTDDIDLKNRCRGIGAKVLATSSLIESRKGRSTKKSLLTEKGGEGKVDVDFWLKFFNSEGS